jgi:WXXGXW repeat (2 copies)
MGCLPIPRVLGVPDGHRGNYQESRCLMNSRTKPTRLRGASLRLAGTVGLLSLAGFATPAFAATPILGDLSLNIQVDAPPPPPRPEVVVGVAPGPDYVWVGGYWDGTPGHYVWVRGRWDHAPHGHGIWVAPHWDRDRDGHYHQTRGEWRDEGPRR